MYLRIGKKVQLQNGNTSKCKIEIKVQLQMDMKSNQKMEIKIQLENENKIPFEDWPEKSIKIKKLRNGGLEKLKSNQNM